MFQCMKAPPLHHLLCCLFTVCCCTSFGSWDLTNVLLKLLYGAHKQRRNSIMGISSLQYFSSLETFCWSVLLGGKEERFLTCMSYFSWWWFRADEQILGSWLINIHVNCTSLIWQSINGSHRAKSNSERGRGWRTKTRIDRREMKEHHHHVCLGMLLHKRISNHLSSVN